MCQCLGMGRFQPLCGLAGAIWGPKMGEVLLLDPRTDPHGGWMNAIVFIGGRGNYLKTVAGGIGLVVETLKEMSFQVQNGGIWAILAGGCC